MSPPAGRWWLRGATVVDGTGAAPVPADVEVTAGVISAVRLRHPGGTPESVENVREDGGLDLSGLVLAPGFIDLHTHSDVSVLLDPAAESKVRQGVTTEVTGNCGFSAFPVRADRRTDLRDHVARLGDEPVLPTWTDLDGYAAAVAEQPPALNVAPLVGHSALRLAASRSPWDASAPADLVAMRRVLDELLAQGAFGFSTGLTHTPSALADPAEVRALVAGCAAAGRVYATHARAAAGRELQAIDEAIETAGRTGARLQFSHLALNDPDMWGRAELALERFERAAAAGQDVAFDVYPYDASSSALVQYLPDWVQADDGAELRTRVSEPAWRRRAVADTERGFFGGIPWHWERVTVTAADPDGVFAGRTLADIAADTGLAPAEVLLDLCARYGGGAQGVLHYRTEADMTRFLAHPLACVGSDGSALPVRPGPARPHPRSFGTFPRVLGRYVREQGVLTLSDAVHKMTGAPARRLGLSDRGEIRVGAVADLVAFDPATITDRATFDEPWQAPAGVQLTVVAGTVVVRDGRQTPARPGTVLRHG